MDKFKAFIPAPLLENRPSKACEEIAVDKLKAHGCAIDEIHIPREEFETWLETVDYDNRFPIYFEEYGPPRQSEGNWIRKRFEHFLTFRLAEITPETRVVDVAAANAPVQRILRDVFGVSESWRQDLNYETNTSRKTIGGDARSLPLDDNSFDALLLHNSWEHFEGESDIEFLREATRVLAPGGRVVITPLFLSPTGWVATSPSIWSEKYSGVSDPPKFRPEVPVLIDDEICQRYAQRHSPELLLKHFKRVPELNPRIIVISNSEDFANFTPYTLLLQKV